MILLTAAFPFVPAELNIAHFASTYVPADISKRLFTVLDKKVLLVSATDYHSIYASRDGKTTDLALCERYHGEYLALFERMNICFDQYFTTEDSTHMKLVRDTFLQMLDNGNIVRAMDIDQVCDNCGCFLPRHFREEHGEKCCHFCGGRHIETHEKPHYFLKLHDTEEQLRDFAATLWQKDVQNEVLRYVASGLSDWNITRYNSLGLPVPGDERQSLYIWFDSLVGYRSLCMNCSEIPQQIIHFFGKNIIYYHSAVWQLLSKQLFGAEIDVQLSARGFLKLEQTDDAMLNLTELSGHCCPDLIRFYLAFKVKDDLHDYSFTEKDFHNVADFYCCKRLGGFFYRAWQLLSNQKNNMIDNVDTYCGDIEGFLQNFAELVFQCNVHEALRLLLSRVDVLTNRFLSHGTHIQLDMTDTDALKYETAVLACLLSAYMPELSKAYTIYEQWIPQSISEAKQFRTHTLKKQKELIKLDGLFL